MTHIKNSNFFIIGYEFRISVLDLSLQSLRPNNTRAVAAYNASNTLNFSIFHQKKKKLFLKIKHPILHNL